MNSFNTLTRNINTNPKEYKYTTVATYITPTPGVNFSISLDSNSILYIASAGDTNANIINNIYTKISSTPNMYYTSTDGYIAPQMNNDSNNTLYLIDNLYTSPTLSTYKLSKITQQGTKQTLYTTTTNLGFIAFDNLNNIFSTTSSNGISLFLAPNYDTGYTVLSPTSGTKTYAEITTGTNASDLKPPTLRYRYIPFVNNGVLYVSCADFIVQMKLSDIYANYNSTTNVLDNTKIPLYKFAGTGTVATITSNINGQQATSVTFNSSRGMAFDKFGNAFIADYDARMIFKVNIATNIISLFIGPTGSDSYSPKIIANELNGRPFYIVIDNNRNKIYISNFEGTTGSTSKILVVS